MCVLRDGTSFFLTLGLRAIYQRFWLKQPMPMAAIVIVSCTLGGVLQFAIVHSLRGFLTAEPEVRFTHSMEFNFFYERTGLLYAWSFLYLGIRHALASKEQELRLTRIESEKRQAQLQMLRAQMNPHFLYNALNTVLAEIGKPRQHLESLVRSLAEYLRYSLETRNDERVPLRQEYDAIVSYLAVEKARFQEKLEIECHIDADARNILVPGIMIQPLVENTIKYGRRTSPSPLKVRVVVSSLDSNGVQIEVSNTGKWIDPDPANTLGGIGLENLKRRLELLYPDSHRVGIFAEDGWVTVQIQIFATL